MKKGVLMTLLCNCFITSEAEYVCGFFSHLLSLSPNICVNPPLYSRICELLFLFLSAISQTENSSFSKIGCLILVFFNVSIDVFRGIVIVCKFCIVTSTNVILCSLHFFFLPSLLEYNCFTMVC